jgi:hypothetical protein
VLRENRNILEPLLSYQAKPHNMALVALQQQILSAVNEHDERIRMQNHEKRSLKMFSPKWYSLLKLSHYTSRRLLGGRGGGGEDT